MRISKQALYGGRFELSAEFGDYDGQPSVDSLQVDHPPRSENPELIGMAAYLTFGRWCGGELILPSKVGPATANAMVRDAKESGISLIPGPIEYYPKALPTGVRDVRLVNTVQDLYSPSICDLRCDLWNGSLRSHTSIIVSSNSFFLDFDSRSIRARVAVALLFPKDLQADKLIVDAPVQASERRKLTSLLASVRIGNEFASEGLSEGDKDGIAFPAEREEVSR